MENKIPTAKEFILNNSGCRKVMMIEFAKLHVEAALKAASNNAFIIIDGSSYEDIYIDKSTILNAYPLTNIK